MKCQSCKNNSLKVVKESNERIGYFCRNCNRLFLNEEFFLKIYKIEIFKK
jgi:hypothetical protein